jgi:hypothetical protein
VRAAGVRDDEDADGSGRVKWIGVFADLSKAIGRSRDAGKQAAKLTEWIIE